MRRASRGPSAYAMPGGAEPVGRLGVPGRLQGGRRGQRRGLSGSPAARTQAIPTRASPKRRADSAWGLTAAGWLAENAQAAASAHAPNHAASSTPTAPLRYHAHLQGVSALAAHPPRARTGHQPGAAACLACMRHSKRACGESPAGRHFFTVAEGRTPRDLARRGKFVFGIQPEPLKQALGQSVPACRLGPVTIRGLCRKHRHHRHPSSQRGGSDTAADAPGRLPRWQQRKPTLASVPHNHRQPQQQLQE